MPKYEDGFKRKVVEVYQNGEDGYATLAQRFSILAFPTVHRWEKISEKREGITTKALDETPLLFPIQA
ncbi:hypothetical protein ACV9TN_003003 [Listeria monocytogenes]|nr:transposase [Listeria monocytogenes]EAC6450203.1 transposase [Listeria monocytogenes]EAC7892639.1 transposase [Listeria monocytogenes]EAC9721832.1 transposase [Listeria monocytogenes]EAC9864798.1 transposase [Listeria monocytogenes]